jgi:hypothetical protein
MKFFEALAQTFAGKPIDWDELEVALGATRRSSKYHMHDALR